MTAHAPGRTTPDGGCPFCGIIRGFLYALPLWAMILAAIHLATGACS